MKKYVIVAIIISLIVGALVGVAIFNSHRAQVIFDNPYKEGDYEKLKEIAISVTKGQGYPKSDNLDVEINSFSKVWRVDVTESFLGVPAWEVRVGIPVIETISSEKNTGDFKLDYSEAKYLNINHLNPVKCTAFIIVISLVVAVFVYLGVTLLYVILSPEYREFSYQFDQKMYQKWDSSIGPFVDRIRGKQEP